ncbi:hypothetical protein CR513_47403, partial [Mucuna pruriens]
MLRSSDNCIFNWVRQTLNNSGESYNLFRMKFQVMSKLEKLLVNKRMDTFIYENVIIVSNCYVSLECACS